MAESGAVYFLGDEYVDRVVRDGEVVYNRNLFPKSIGNWEDYNIDAWVSGSGTEKTLETLGLEIGNTVTLSAEIQAEKSDATSCIVFNNTSGGTTAIMIGNKIEEGNTGKSTKTAVVPNLTTLVTFWKARKVEDNCRGKSRNHKLELGTTATPYTVAPEDLFPSVETFPSFPEWPDEGGY